MVIVSRGTVCPTNAAWPTNVHHDCTEAHQLIAGGAHNSCCPRRTAARLHMSCSDLNEVLTTCRQTASAQWANPIQARSAC